MHGILNFLRRLRRGNEPPEDHWVKDSECSTCYECGREFTLIVRRHHCRMCGGVHCEDCASKYLPAAAFSHLMNVTSGQRCCKKCFERYLNSLPNDYGSRAREENTQLDGARGETAEDGVTGNSLLPPNGSAPSRPPRPPSKRQPEDAPAATPADLPTPLPSDASLAVQPKSQPSSLSADTDSSKQGTPRHPQTSLAFAGSPLQRAAAPSHHKLSHSAIPMTLTPAREPSKAAPPLPSPLVRMHKSESIETDSVKDSNATPRAPGAVLVSTIRSIIQHASPRIGNQNAPTQLSAAHRRASTFSQWTSGRLPEDLDLGTPTSAQRTQRSLQSQAAQASSAREESSLCWEEPVQVPTDYGDLFISGSKHQPHRRVPPSAGWHNGSAGRVGQHMLNRSTNWSHPSAAGGGLSRVSSGALLGETTPRAGGLTRGTRRSAGAPLMGEMPRELQQSLPPVTADLRKGLSVVARSHLSAIINQLLVAEEVEEREAWLPVVHNLAMQCARYLTPTQICKQQQGSMMDPRHYLKVKRIADGRSAPSKSEVIQGVVFTKSLADRSMSTSIKAPRVLLLRRAVEPEASQLTAMESLTKEAPEQGSASDPRAEKLRALKPDLVLVQQTVPRTTKDLLKAHHISLAMKVEGGKEGRKDNGLPHLDRLAMCSGKTVADGIDDISEENVMTCANFNVEEVGVASSADAPGGGRTARKSLMIFQGTRYGLGCTVLLRGRSLSELVRVKRVLRFAVFAAYRARLEIAFLADVLSSLVSTLNPSLHRTQHSVPASIAWGPPELQGEKFEDWARWAAAVGTSCVNTERPVMSTSPYVQKWRFPEDSDAGGELAPTRGRELGLARQDSVDEEKLQAALDSKANQENSSICYKNRTEVTYMVINPDNTLPCVPAKPQSFSHYGKDDLRIVDVLSIFRPFERCGECNDSMSKHLAMYFHGNKRVCIRAHPVPPGPGDGTGENGCADGACRTSGASGRGAKEVWLWVRVKNRERTERGHCRKVRLSAAAQCMSFGHFLEIMCSKSSLMVDNAGLHSHVVMYFKIGNFMVALSSDFTHVFGVQMPQDPIFISMKNLKDMIRGEAGSLRKQVDKSVFSQISTLVEGLRQMATQPLQHVEGKRLLASGTTSEDLTKAMNAKLEELRNLEELLARQRGEILHGLDDVVQVLSTDMMVEDHKALDVWLTQQRVPKPSAAFRRLATLRLRVLELRALVSKFMVEWEEKVTAIQKGLNSAIETHTQPVPQHQKNTFSLFGFQASMPNMNPSPTPPTEPFPSPLDPPAPTPAPQQEEGAVVRVTLAADVLGRVVVHMWSETLQREPAGGTKSALQRPSTPTTRSFASPFQDDRCEDEKSTQSGDASSPVAAGAPEAPPAIRRPPQPEHPPTACLSITAVQLNAESAFNNDETPRVPPSSRAVLLKRDMSDTTATTGGVGRLEDMERSSSGGTVIDRREDTGSPGSECGLAPGRRESSAQLAFKDVVSGSPKLDSSPGRAGRAGRASSARQARENKTGAAADAMRVHQARVAPDPDVTSASGPPAAAHVAEGSAAGSAPMRHQHSASLGPVASGSFPGVDALPADSARPGRRHRGSFSFDGYDLQTHTLQRSGFQSGLGASTSGLQRAGAASSSHVPDSSVDFLPRPGAGVPGTYVLSTTFNGLDTAFNDTEPVPAVMPHQRGHRGPNMSVSAGHNRTITVAECTASLPDVPFGVEPHKEDDTDTPEAGVHPEEAEFERKNTQSRVLEFMRQQWLGMDPAEEAVAVRKKPAAPASLVGDTTPPATSRGTGNTPFQPGRRDSARSIHPALSGTGTELGAQANALPAPPGPIQTMRTQEDPSGQPLSARVSSTCGTALGAATVSGSASGAFQSGHHGHMGSVPVPLLAQDSAGNRELQKGVASAAASSSAVPDPMTAKPHRPQWHIMNAGPGVGGISIPVYVHCPASAIAHFLSSQKYHDAVTAKHKQFRAAWQERATGTASEGASARAPRSATQDSAHADTLSPKALTTGGGPASELGDDGEGAGGDGGGAGNVSQRELAGHAVVPPRWPMWREDSLRSMMGQQLVARMGLPDIDIDALDIATGVADAGAARDPATEEELSLAILEAATKHDTNEISVEFSEVTSGHQHSSVRCKVTSYFPMQFRELRRRVIEGGDLAFVLSLSRSDQMRPRGGKSSAGFFLTKDHRFMLKAVIDREKSSTMTTAAQHFQHYARCHREGGSTCFAKTLGMFFVEIKNADTEFKEWLIVTENVYYDLPESSLVRRFDLKGKAPTLKRQPPTLHTVTTEPDPDHAAPEESEQGGGSAAGTGGGRHVKFSVNNNEGGGSVRKGGKRDMDGDTMFLDDYGVKPLIVPTLEHDRLMTALERDVKFLVSMKITDYSMLLAVDGLNGVIRVGIIDYVRPYRIGEGLEQFTKGMLKPGRTPTVIQPQRYADRFREAITKYFTRVPFDNRHSRPDLTREQICWPPAQRS